MQLQKKSSSDDNKSVSDARKSSVKQAAAKGNAASTQAGIAPVIRPPAAHAEAANNDEEQPVQPHTAGKPVILQILPELHSGGVERGTLEISSALVQQGWGSLVVSNGGGLVKSLESKGGKHIKMSAHSKNPLRMYLNVLRLQRLIRKHNVSLVHARSRAPAWCAWLACKREGIPLVTTFHGHYSLPNGFKHKYNSIMVKGDRVIAISDFTAEHIKNHYPVDESKMRIVPRGVDLDVFKPEKVNQYRLVSLANQWRLPDDLPILFMPGRLTRWKGQHVLIRALGILERRDFFCVIAGDDRGHPNYRHELEDMILDRDLGSNVRIVPPTNDMPAAYMLAHVVVAPSTRPEAFGRVPAEAGAMGRPVIASDHGGARETVVPGETGWLVHPDNAGALSVVIDEALSFTKGGYERMGNAAIDHSTSNFALTDMCRKTIDTYKELVDSA